MPRSMPRPAFDPAIWGPHMWFMIHLAALRFPENPTLDDKKHFYTFFKSLQYVLPCDGCCRGFSDILDATGFGPAHLKNRDALFAWTVAAHDAVNAKTRKPTGTSWKVWKKRYLELAL